MTDPLNPTAENHPTPGETAASQPLHSYLLPALANHGFEAVHGAEFLTSTVGPWEITVTGTSRTNGDVDICYPVRDHHSLQACALRGTDDFWIVFDSGTDDARNLAQDGDAMVRAIREFLLTQEAEQPVFTEWINPRCGCCDVGHFAYQPSTAALHCTSPVCDHWILPSELVDADGWEIRDGILAVPN